MDSLATWVAREGALPAIDAVGWTLRVAQFVEELARCGEAHGSLSPEAVLADAAHCAGEGELIERSRAPRLAAYVSPERSENDPPSPVDDTWAVAVTLYFLLTTRLPFPGADDQQVQWRVLSGHTTVMARIGDVDPWLEAIVERALLADIEKRTTSIAELRKQLEAWRPNERLGELPALTERPDAEDDRTLIRPNTDDIQARIDAVIAKRAAAATQAAPPVANLPSLADEDDTTTNAAPPPSLRTPPASLRTPPRIEETSQPGSSPSSPEPVALDHRRRSSTLRSYYAAVAVSAIAASAFVAWRRGLLHWPHKPPAPAASVTASPLVSASIAPPIESATASLAASAAVPSTSASASAAPRVAAPEDVTSCARSMLPKDAFDEKANVDTSFLCTETDPRRGALSMKKRLVASGHGVWVTEGMREWAALGWYEMPAFTVIRATCCASSPPIELPPIPGTKCESFASLLTDLGAEAAADPSSSKTSDALGRYTHNVYCAFRMGAATTFGPGEPPSGGEEGVFRKLLARASAHRSR